MWNLLTQFCLFYCICCVLKYLFIVNLLLIRFYSFACYQSVDYNSTVVNVNFLSFILLIGSKNNLNYKESTFRFSAEIYGGLVHPIVHAWLKSINFKYGSSALKKRTIFYVVIDRWAIYFRWQKSTARRSWTIISTTWLKRTPSLTLFSYLRSLSPGICSNTMYRNEG